MKNTDLPTEITERLDGLVTGYSFSESGPTIFFCRSNEQIFQNSIDYLSDKLTGKNLPFEFKEIKLDEEQLPTIQTDDPNYLLIIKNFEGIQDPHSLCKRLMYSIDAKCLVGIYVNPKGIWGTELPYSMSNHYNAFIQHVTEE
ncbi:hypothetical protein HOK51_08815 [Candidatus Woesearchaeota archaeon]|jgi:hypothetical protein|nr:hypothetical protein [Candidatus Woesearchaeota archaeon]MBT6519929.1 hypothetical protein [Candidatus Woesearchaeota archaeon]MBT7367095.1 hypothetical protein [Candidatus Woesearchaeota archaeon]